MAEISAFGGDKVMYLLRIIEKYHERFKKPPIGPIGAHLLEDLSQKQPSEIENVRVNDSDGVSTSDGIGGAIINTLPSGLSSEKSLNVVSQSSNQGSLADRTCFVRNDLNTLSTSLVEGQSDIDETKTYNASVATAYAAVNQKNEANNANDIYGIHTGGLGGIPYAMTNNQSTHLPLQESQEFGSNTTQSSLRGMNEYQSNKSNTSLKDYAVSDHEVQKKIKDEQDLLKDLLQEKLQLDLCIWSFQVGFSSGFSFTCCPCRIHGWCTHQNWFSAAEGFAGALTHLTNQTDVVSVLESVYKSLHQQITSEKKRTTFRLTS
ncbi:hypothetical protein RIF29_19264 [Crotalaria pallida]|uniref:Uncharacterized protein n=1 Tax=Crotalaria pallida TaxID=3830 RepID=A0AAN9F1F9_CROPI